MSDLLAPIEDITLETYAHLSAQRAGMPVEEFAKLVAQHGMDMEKFGRVEKGWNDRMASDATAAVATEYGKYFMAAGQGQYGAAGAEASANMSFTTEGVSHSETTAADPVPFEKFCEVSAAQQAWAETGQDVNAMLESTFGMTAIDWASISSHWMNKAMSDMSLFEKQSELEAQFKAKYMAGTGGEDDDLEF